MVDGEERLHAVEIGFQFPHERVTDFGHRDIDSDHEGRVANLGLGPVDMRLISQFLG